MRLTAALPRSLRTVARAVPLLVATLLVACGGGGGGDSSSPAPSATAPAPTVAQLANICTNAGEKAWIAAYLNDVYLFYRDIVAVDPNAYATPEDYFDALLVHSKDRFSFVEAQSTADAFFTAGQDIGYGAVFKLDPANNLRIGFVEATGPLAAAAVGRGAQIVTLNGQTTAALSTAQLNVLLFPASVGVSLALTVLDPGQTVARSVVVSSANVVEDPVPLARVLSADPADAASARVGYLLFNEQIATSESELVTAMAGFKAAGVTDLVIDLRYNGGGFLYIASELSQMIGGSRIPAGATFDRLVFNDKHPEKTADPANNTGFRTTTTGGQTLPTLDLARVFVITAPGTCSASEAIINGLAPFVNVIRIGGTTCGKPYGFIQQNNCAKAYFAIQFQGVNNVGFGDFQNGFTPLCAVDDDFGHALGDRAESRLSTALAFSRTGACPVAAVTNATARATARLPASPAEELGRPERSMLRR